MKIVAEKIKDSIKRPRDFVARYGGEEFVIVLPETDQIGALAVAERVRSSIFQLELPHESSLHTPAIVTVSVGVATMILNLNVSSDLLIQFADKALYQSKQQGRNRVSCYVDKE